MRAPANYVYVLYRPVSDDQQHPPEFGGLLCPYLYLINTLYKRDVWPLKR